MLSNDELTHGMPFVLTLWNGSGEASHWVETLRDDVARHWYEIYRSSDWDALRAEGPRVFRTRVTEDESRALRSYGRRCVVIHTTEVASEAMAGA
jgi:hypothetical protein